MKKSMLKLGLVFYLILIFVGAIILPSSSEKIVIYNNHNQHYVDFNSALKVADIKIFELWKSDIFYILTSEVIYSDEIGVLFYLFDMYPKGFIVVSGDSRLPPVLFYSFTSVGLCNNIDDNMLINILKLDVEFRLKNIDFLPIGVIEYRQGQWNNFLNTRKMNLTNTNFEQWPTEGTTDTEGWVQTQWNQKSPFNNLCPIDGNDRSVAGCPSIAMAQIINYHENTHGTRFYDNDDYYHNYSNFFMIDDDYQQYDFPSFPELNNYLTILDSHYANDIKLSNDDKAALTFACGVAAKQVYTDKISGTFSVIQAYDAYHKFGCNSILLFDNKNFELYDRLIDNMKNAFPAHLALVTQDWKTGHNMVLDGYNTDDFYHINFGYGGIYDGWYLLPDEEMPFGLTVIEGVIVDIMNDKNVSNLECYGTLVWNDIKGGSILNGSFEIKNIGMQGSELDWEIESYPSWGFWNFSDIHGENLKPEDGTYTIDVSVVTPDKKNKDIDGSIKIINKEAKGDCDYIYVTLSIQKNKSYFLNILEQLIYHFPILEKILK